MRRELTREEGIPSIWGYSPPPSLPPHQHSLLTSGTFPARIPPSRSFIPEEQCQGRSPQLLLQSALAHMHYLPEEPGAAGMASAYRQMARLLQYRAVRVQTQVGLLG